MGSAVLVGLVSGLVVAILTLLLTVFVRALRGGASLGQAFRALAITDAEDWELIPVFLAGSLVIGAVSLLFGVAVWWAITTRAPDRPRAARLGAAAAAGVSCLLVQVGSVDWSLALPVSVAAAVVAGIVTPVLGRPRVRSSE